MRKVVILILLLVILMAGVFITVKYGPAITAAVVGGDKCVSPAEALIFINEKDCTRIYESPKCSEQGKVQVQC